jgi:hypothetical protein
MMDGFRCKILLLLLLYYYYYYYFPENFHFHPLTFLDWFGLVCCVYPPSDFLFERLIFAFFLWKYDSDTYR